MNFVIVAYWRTGSTQLVHLLNGHSGILCNGELFMHGETRLPVEWNKEDKVRDGDAMRALRKSDPMAFLAKIYERNYGGKSVGFKIFPGHNDAILDFLLSDISVRKIVLYRRNLLANYSSFMIARQTKSHKQTSRDSVAEERPRVNFRARHFKRHCTRYLSYYRSVFERLNASRQTFHLVDYDEINDPWHFARLVAFIGEEPPREQPKTKLLKQNPSDILSRFSNPDEVAEFLSEYNLTGWRYEPPTSLDPFGEAGAGGAEADDAESDDAERDDGDPAVAPERSPGKFSALLP